MVSSGDIFLNFNSTNTTYTLYKTKRYPYESSDPYFVTDSEGKIYWSTHLNNFKLKVNSSIKDVPKFIRRLVTANELMGEPITFNSKEELLASIEKLNLIEELKR